MLNTKSWIQRGKKRQRAGNKRVRGTPLLIWAWLKKRGTDTEGGQTTVMRVQHCGSYTQVCCCTSVFGGELALGSRIYQHLLCSTPWQRILQYLQINRAHPLVRCKPPLNHLSCPSAVCPVLEPELVGSLDVKRVARNEQLCQGHEVVHSRS